ncbi:MAG: ABC transporter substrate-binding protein [Planctomycetota bacterium]|nr:ABC transporter substrate-binding protein [Planctomycetota bacterium]
MVNIARALLFAFALSCSADDKPHADNLLHYTLGAEPSSFDPVKSENIVNAVLQRQILECLFEYDYATNDAQVSPLLATSVEVSDDGLQYDILLRHDAQFFDPFEPALFDGRLRAVNAHDVVFCWLRQADARLNSDGWWAINNTFVGINKFHRATANSDPRLAQQAFDDAVTNGIEGLQVIDDFHLRVRLQRRDIWFLNRLAMSYFAVYPHEAVESDRRSMRDQPVGSAVFYLEQFVPGQNVLITRSANWRGETPGDATGVEFQVVRDAQTAIEMFRRGLSDRLTLSANSAKQFLNENGELKKSFVNDGVTVSNYPRSDISMLCFNMQDSEIGNVPTDDAGNALRRQLRHALALAFPREQWQDLLYQRLPFISATSFIPPNVGEKHRVYPWHDDLTQARQILDKAGYYSQHELPQVEFVLFGTDPMSLALGEIYSVALKEIGIECKLVAVPYAQQMQRAANGEAQIFVRNWTLDWPDSRLIYDTFKSGNIGSSINLSRFNDQRFDNLMDELALAQDTTQLRQIEAQLDAILYDECPAMPIEHRQSWVLGSKRITNFKMRPFDLMPCKFYILKND